MSKKDLTYLDNISRHHRIKDYSAVLVKHGISLSNKLSHFKGKNILKILNAWKELPAYERNEYTSINNLEEKYNRSTKHNIKGDFTNGLPHKKILPELSHRLDLSNSKPTVLFQKDTTYTGDSILLSKRLSNPITSRLDSIKNSPNRKSAYTSRFSQESKYQSVENTKPVHRSSSTSRISNQKFQFIRNNGMLRKVSTEEKNISLVLLRDHIIRSDQMKKHLLKIAKQATPTLKEAETIYPDDQEEELIHRLCDCSMLNTNLSIQLGINDLEYNLYISCAKVGNDLSQLKKYQIHSILNIGTSINKYSYIKGGYRDIPLNSENLDEYRDMVYIINSFISLKMQEGNLLICCYSGLTKSCFVFISYLMTRYKHSLSKSVAILKNLRPNSKIDARYYEKLLRLEKHLIKFQGIM